MRGITWPILLYFLSLTAPAACERPFQVCEGWSIGCSLCCWGWEPMVSPSLKATLVQWWPLGPPEAMSTSCWPLLPLSRPYYCPLLLRSALLPPTPSSFSHPPPTLLTQGQGCRWPVCCRTTVSHKPIKMCHHWTRCWFHITPVFFRKYVFDIVCLKLFWIDLDTNQTYCPLRRLNLSASWK